MLYLNFGTACSFSVREALQRWCPEVDPHLLRRKNSNGIPQHLFLFLLGARWNLRFVLNLILPIYMHYFLFCWSLHVLSSLTMFQCGFYWINELSILTADVECSSGCGRLTHPVVSTTRVVTAVFTPDIVLFMVQRTEACGQLHTAVLADNGHGGCGSTTTPTAGKGHVVSLADSGALWPRGQLQSDPCGRVWKNITAYMYR